MRENCRIRLHWPRTDDSTPSLPLRVVETYSNLPTEIPDWNNLLIWGDNLYVLRALLPLFRNAAQFIYIDPPFFTGTAETIDIPRGIKSETSGRGPAPVRDVAYKNVWVEGNPTASFSQWFYSRARLMRRLLRPTGFLAVRFDYHFGHYAKMVLDRVFGLNNFLGEILVRRMDKTVSKKALATQKHLIVQHDSLFLYRKSPQARFFEFPAKLAKPDRDPFESANAQDNLWIDIDGYEKKKKTYYPTENSVALLARAIQLCSQEGDLVADFFAGSGTTLYAAATMNRRWIGADINRYAINEIRKRILQYAESTGSFGTPLQILDVETYRSHVIRAKLYPHDLFASLSVCDYHKWILDQFEGVPIAGFDSLHGQKGDAYIHIGSLGAPISSPEIEHAMSECEATNAPELIVLGWDYCLVPDLVKSLRERAGGVTVDLRIIPESLLHDTTRELPTFRELPCLEFNVTTDNNKRKVELDFTHYYTSPGQGDQRTDDLDMLDFWAIDWEYAGHHPLRQQDFSFRRISSKGRRLGQHAGRHVEHQYERSGTYTAVITLFDILGNVTTECCHISFLN
ncbi:MAG TPA: site-specific DNA-methyltransferase [Candidatus Lokiarchaeia archaeon]|nr:site-specific DNA-methyltransferase [Candidatus Lokiarchaeia archaeon]